MTTNKGSMKKYYIVTQNRLEFIELEPHFSTIEKAEEYATDLLKGEKFIVVEQKRLSELQRCVSQDLFWKISALEQKLREMFASRKDGMDYNEKD